MGLPSLQELLQEDRLRVPKIKLKLTWQQIATIVLCFIVDISDYFGLAVPYIGDIADAFLILILTKYFGKKAWIANTIQSFEMLPGADVLPLSIIAAIIILYEEYKGMFTYAVNSGQKIHRTVKEKIISIILTIIVILLLIAMVIVGMMVLS